MANIEFDLTALCQQRKKRTELIKSMELFKNRYEPINPYIAYPQNTRYDFDMRRKAEILKYNNNSSQSNPKLSRSMKWSRLVNSSSKAVTSFRDTILYQNDGSGNYSAVLVKYPDTYTVSQQVIGYDIYDNSINMDVYSIVPGTLPPSCPTKFNTPSTSSGVPGRTINLYLDEDVPLVYYNKNVNAYGINNTTTTDPWTTVTKNNFFFSDRINNLFINLVINNSINNFSHTFSMKIPISIYFKATVKYDIPDGLISLSNNTIAIDTINLFTFYNGKQIIYQTQPILTLDNPETLSFDVSLDKKYVQNITYDSKGVAINNSYYNNTITIQYYLGMLNISNLYLLTAPSYIYDINLNFARSQELNALFSSYFDTPTFGVYCNVDSNYSKKIANNVDLSNNSIYELGKFQFSGI
jgi:hypothetical protein